MAPNCSVDPAFFAAMFDDLNMEGGGAPPPVLGSSDAIHATPAPLSLEAFLERLKREEVLVSDGDSPNVFRIAPAIRSGVVEQG